MTHEITIAYDYWQLYLYDDAAVFSADAGEFRAALDDARRSGRSVGLDRGLVDLLMPSQFNFGAPITIAVKDAEPRVDGAAWDHVVEFDLDLPSGRLTLEAPAGGRGIAVDVPAGAYRARLSGSGFDAAYEGADGGDAYLLELWPRLQPAEPRELKRWQTYDALRA